MPSPIDTTIVTPSSVLATTPSQPSSGPQTSDSGRTERDHTPALSQKISDVVELSGTDKDLAALKARDREVRAHEAAHAAAAGSLSTGGPQYSFQRGSDGRLYAVGGEVNIDTSPIPGDPQATIQKAQRIRSAALAPANPSAQDRSVAAQATRLEAQARQELQEERTKHIQNATSAPYSQSISPSHLFDVFA